MRESRFTCCAAEPCSDALFEYPAELLEHMRTAHPGQPIPLRLPTVRLPEEGPAPLRIFCCRVCAHRIETRDREARPYCPEHDPGVPEEIHHAC